MRDQKCLTKFAKQTKSKSCPNTICQGTKIKAKAEGCTHGVVRADSPNCIPCFRQAEGCWLQAIREGLDWGEKNTDKGQINSRHSNNL